ncbi:histidine phosphatase family protein [Lapidilactobacillus mulanensis]|uniref:Histidine phosphatase family protein n=1 Tax=Lapidilactobacillus mulanensis TaxID=2485999 RepID=A0ABW4DMZ6_9LACO|nr:histidine phosphatase family protein [Lapidilactobacillus mulanensis]
MPIQLDDRLVERKISGWLPDFAQYSDQQWQNLDFSAAAGETIRQVQQRYLNFMTALPEDAHVAIGSHGTAMSSVVEAAWPEHGQAFFKRIPFAAVIRITMTAGKIDSVEVPMAFSTLEKTADVNVASSQKRVSQAPVIYLNNQLNIDNANY